MPTGRSTRPSDGGGSTSCRSPVISDVSGGDTCTSAGLNSSSPPAYSALCSHSGAVLSSTVEL
ncbi:hypothetical protein D3C87_1311660 [compost metagenome]